MRFRGELDSLLDALRAAVADKARAQAAVSEQGSRTIWNLRRKLSTGLLNSPFTFLWP